MKNFTNNDMNYIRDILHNKFEELEEDLENVDKKSTEYKNAKKEIKYLDDLIDRFDCNCDVWVDESTNNIKNNYEKN